MIEGSRQTPSLLIDGDLRRPQLGQIFVVDKKHPSLLEWLVAEKSNLSRTDLISGNVIDNLDLISSRASEEYNPAKLPGRGRLAELIEWARAHYDRVIIDTPPRWALSAMPR